MFIDLKKMRQAKNKKVFEAMESIGINEKLIRLVKMTDKKGLRESSSLSTTLYKIVLNENIIKQVMIMARMEETLPW